jgi:hypothetical protein
MLWFIQRSRRKRRRQTQNFFLQKDMPEIDSKKNKIGEFLKKRNYITEEQNKQVLELQKHNPDMKYGEIALELHFIDSNVINQYIIYIHSEE